jgi:hypothetical protein
MTKKITKSLLILAVSGLMFAGASAAQTQNSNTSGAGPGQVDPGHPRVNEVNTRETNQQDRIANGVKNGQLTRDRLRAWKTANSISRTSKRRIWPLTMVTDERRTETAQQRTEPCEQANLQGQVFWEVGRGICLPSAGAKPRMVAAFFLFSLPLSKSVLTTGLA